MGHELYGPLVLYFNGVLLFFWHYKSMYTHLFCGEKKRGNSGKHFISKK